MRQSERRLHGVGTTGLLRHVRQIPPLGRTREGFVGMPFRSERDTARRRRVRAFVIGHPRSGTMFVSDLLRAGEDSVCGHEVLVQLDRGFIALATDYYEGRRSREEVMDALRSYETAPEAIDSNWKLVWILPCLLQAFSRAKIVHLVRDPRANVRSCIELDYYGQLVDDARLEVHESARAWYRAMPAFPRDDWHTMDILERNCAFWNESHRLAEEGLRHWPEVKRVRLEDLSDEEHVRSVFRFLGVEEPTRPSLVAALNKRANLQESEKAAVAALRPRAWTHEDEARVWALCGERARAYGYRAERDSRAGSLTGNHANSSSSG